MDGEPVTIDYTNHRGERSKRMVHPESVWFGESQFHEGPQWFLRALDLSQLLPRDFALKDIHGWQPGADE
jgi:predicted DNA-binding transcriptional regulator YafY